MKIKIIETGEINYLSIIDPITNVDWINDFVGAGLETDFTYDEEGEYYLCSQYVYDWWKKVASEYEAVQFRIEEMKSEYGSDIIRNIIDNSGVGLCDFEHNAAHMNAALDQFLFDLNQQQGSEIE